MRKLTIDNLNPAPYNPRMIGDAELNRLRKSLQVYGDISGIVWNSRTGHIVAGHQRIKAMGDDIKIVGQSIRTATGETFSIRVVDWDLPTEKAANIAANSPGAMGTFDDALLSDLLRAMRDDGHDLEMTMLDDDLIAAILSEKEALDSSSQLGDLEYRIILKCENEKHHAETLRSLQEQGFQCQVLIS
jgi:hypothetical protein